VGAGSSGRCNTSIKSFGWSCKDGDYTLKYFLVDRANKRNDIDLPMKHSRGRPTAVQQQHQVQPKARIEWVRGLIRPSDDFAAFVSRFTFNKS